MCLLPTNRTEPDYLVEARATIRFLLFGHAACARRFDVAAAWPANSSFLLCEPIYLDIEARCRLCEAAPDSFPSPQINVSFGLHQYDPIEESFRNDPNVCHNHNLVQVGEANVHRDQNFQVLLKPF